MSKSFSLTVEPRTVQGKQVKHLRKAGIVPANVFSRGKDSVAVQASYQHIAKLYLDAGKTHPVELQLGDKQLLALVNDVEFDPVKNVITHVTFQEVKKGEKVTADVPLHLVGESPAERANLIVVQMRDTITVEAEATHIPDAFDGDKSLLAAADDVLKISDLTVPAGITILDELDTVLAKVDVPRAEVEAVAEAETAEQAEAPAA
jgi:large subunit ribosomal protein L25